MEIDEGFKLFASRVEMELERFGSKMTDDQLLLLQRKQLETLHDLENEFRTTLLKHRWGQGVYEAFVNKICVENGNILTSRPYFRERQDVCIGPISKALAEGDVKTISKFHCNYNFIAWTMKLYRWWPGSKLMKLFKAIEKARHDIVILNTPLAISQARIFWSKAPAKAAYTHLTYMDLIQVGLDGLVSATDKFVLPTKEKFKNPIELLREFRRFRPMAIQRMVGNFIESYSETPIHFFPKYKRMLYRANKYMARHSDEDDPQKLVDSVNKDAEGRLISGNARTNTAEIFDLMAAASNLGPTDSTLVSGNDDVDSDTFLNTCADSEETRPDVRVERAQTSSRLQEAILGLSVIEQKFLKMKGIALS